MKTQPGHTLAPTAPRPGRRRREAAPGSGRLWWLAAVALLAAGAARAFPPAPHHVLFGLVRDEVGEPLFHTNAQVFLETTNGLQITSPITPNLEPGANYRIPVSMDAGVTGDSYKTTALQPMALFRMKVRIGQMLYLPLEMIGDYSHLGRPGERTRIDLTLGEDSDDDGLPDAWERALIQMAGGNLTLQSIRPQDDFDGDGLSNLSEYLAGTYAFDSQDGLSVNLVQLDTNGMARLEFLAIRGRTYTVQASSNLLHWTSVPFRISSQGPASPLLPYYRAIDVRLLQVDVSPEGAPPTQQYFKLMLE